MNGKLLMKLKKIILGGDFNIASNSWLDRTPRRGQQPELNDTLASLTVDHWRTSNPTTKNTHG